MAGKAQAGWQPSMSDEAVKARTGRGWMGWFTILNKANANALPHKDIAALLHEKHGVPGWWAQMITVEYERARGGRQKHERPDGYSVSISKTFVAPLSKLYAATADAKQRGKWFPKEAFRPSSQTKDKYFRGSWSTNGARLEMGFYAKGEGKSQLAVQVSKLAKKTDVERERTRWKQALGRLAGLLSS
jgi:hypothetical protein